MKDNRDKDFEKNKDQFKKVRQHIQIIDNSCRVDHRVSLIVKYNRRLWKKH